MALWYNKQKDQEKPHAERTEIKTVVELYNKFKTDKMEASDKLCIKYP